MTQQLEKKIIKLYLSGYGSTTIAKLIPTTTKKQILKVIKTNNLLRNRLIPLDFYKNFWVEENKWCGEYICNQCKESIKFYVNNKSLLNRNLKKKNICRECSLKNQAGTNNPFYGKSHSIETKNSISKTKKGVTTSDHCGKPEYKKLFSNLAKERWASGKMDTTRIKLSESMKSRIASGQLKGYNRSKAEFELINYFEDLELEVEPNYIIEGKIFDLYLPKYNLLIEYNGDYWHCNPSKYNGSYFNKKKNKTAEEIWIYDQEKLYLSVKNGYDCIIIWESDYKKDKDNVLKKIITKYEKPI